jgi:hypothetical protein
MPKKELIMNWVGLKLRPIPVKGIEDHRVEQIETRKILEMISAENPASRLLDPAEIFCFDGACVWHEGWHLLYKDDDHLSIYGSEKLSPLFKEFFSKLQ